VLPRGHPAQAAESRPARRGRDALHRRAYTPLRASKSSIYEGGHRVPFLARWPGKIKAGSVCDDTICLNDFMVTCADILGAKLPDSAGE
jgi:arylsulfatase A